MLKKLIALCNKQRIMPTARQLRSIFGQMSILNVGLLVALLWVPRSVYALLPLLLLQVGLCLGLFFEMWELVEQEAKSKENPTK